MCALLSLSAGAFANDHDHDKDNHGHDGMPPGQAKKYDNDDRDGRGLPPGQVKHMEEGRPLPPGQAKKYFRYEDRDVFYTRYHVDVDRWRGRKRPVFVVGQPYAVGYVVQPVPRSVWVNVGPAPPPPGYQYGYYGGYVVAYNPTTRIIADVLDIADAARH
jgi:hypothetical protein